MSKMSELSAMIDNLISCGETWQRPRALKEFYSGTEEAARQSLKKTRNRISLLRKHLLKAVLQGRSQRDPRKKQTKQKAASRLMSKRSFRSTATEAALPMWIRRTTRRLSERWKD
ncbi:MAG: hypothetical protein ACLRTA_06400 [Clostridia bacterium]